MLTGSNYDQAGGESLRKKISFLERLELSENPILADGAMGTMLNAKGIKFDQCLDALNLTHPELVLEIHRAYVAAGAQLLQTNTFGANRFKLAEHKLADKVIDINHSGVDLARQVVQESHKEVLVAGDVGPLGVRLAPYGRIQPEEAQRVFHEQVAALFERGVDLFILETISDLNEMLVAISAVQEVCELPIVASMTFTRDDRTLLGDPPKRVVKILQQGGADVIGINCSGGPAQILRILREMHEAAPEVLLSAMPNAGWPERVGGRFMYPASPGYFGDYSRAFKAAGARLIGGCCGTTPQHIAQMWEGLQKPEIDIISESNGITFDDNNALAGSEDQPSKFSRKLTSGEYVVSVEMDPPRGLSTHKLMAGASLLAEAGADVINIADSPMARMRMSPWAVCNLIQREFNIETVLHFPTRGRNLLRVQGDLLAAHAMDIRNIFVVMGDPTEIGDYPDAMDDFDLVPSGLIRLIKCGFNLGYDHAGVEIGQPTSFFVGCALNLAPQDISKEIKYLQRKIESGADFVLTQPVYNPEVLASFIHKFEEKYGRFPLPVLVGVLPLISPRHAEFLHNEVPGIQVPAEIRQRMVEAAEASAQEGVRIAVELIKKMRPATNGIYLMPAFNRYDLTVEILDQIK